jgi:hypothetical protein
MPGADLILGGARVSRVGDDVSSSRTLRKDCFGETPKPTRETRALPRKNFVGELPTIAGWQPALPRVGQACATLSVRQIQRPRHDQP